MNERQKGDIGFVIACKYPVKPFELLKEAFYQVPFLAGVPVHTTQQWAKVPSQELSDLLIDVLKDKLAEDE